MQPLRGNLGPLTLASKAPLAWWQVVTGKTPVGAYAAKGAGSLAESYINLANPGTYNAAPGVAPNFNTATGWGGTGTQWLTTGILPTAGNTILVRFSGVPTNNNGCVMGSFKNASTYMFMHPSVPASNQYYFGYGNSPVTGANGSGIASGVMAIAGGKRYINGSLLSTSGTWTGTGAALYLLARNNNGAMDSPLTGNVQAALVYFETLTDAEVLTATNAMNLL